ncbi:DUF2000 domain-containing protein [Candidatus Solirubrobacter pratensis]|uniref:DUF2000 domain-containing protein n=1 Tax=Candidatus Solirubrobacter pratensis TaxID=1298857 RepID=UPI0003F5D3B3|nr:DUF2000 domain-containing protein [Candidatus Solirubrobacter pratensis]
MAAQTMTSTPEPQTTATRTVLVIDRELPKGLAANAAAILALTLGVHRPQLIGAPFEDAAGSQHPGLIPTGLPVLGAEAAELPAIRDAARERGLLVVDAPVAAQQTNDYDEFRAAVAASPELGYLALLVSGPPKAVRAVTGQLALLR